MEKTQSSPRDTVQERLARRYLTLLVSSPAGRAHILNQLADAESNGEGALFDRVLSQVDDPELQKLIRRHAADEVRHAEMFRACVARTGVTPPAVPSHLKMIDKLDRAAGSFLDQPITDRKGVMDAYVMLQVIEERAITQFKLFEAVFRQIDPETADVFLAIAKDEERHLKYCHAISKRYAPDELTRERTLRRFRELEAGVFAENGNANMRHTLQRGYLAVGRFEKLFWRGVAELGRRRGGTRQPTPYWGDELAARANHQGLTAEVA